MKNHLLGLQAPELIKQQPAAERISGPKPVQEPTFGERAKGVLDFGRDVGQAIARSFAATSAEVAESLDMLSERPGLGEATYQPKRDWEKKLFGTEQPISIKSIGDEVLAIGGDDFKERFGSASIPLGFLIAGLDVTPIGFKRRAAMKGATKTISKTQNIPKIEKALKPLFKDATPDTLRGLATSLRNVNNPRDVEKILKVTGSVNPPGVARISNKPLTKPEADGALFQLEDYMRQIQTQPLSETRAIQREIKRTQGLRLAGKIEGAEANKRIASLRDALTDAAQKEGIGLRITGKGGVVPAIGKGEIPIPKEFQQYTKFQDVPPGLFGGTLDTTRMIQKMDGSLSVAKRAGMRGQAGPLERGVLWRTRDISKMRSAWLGDNQKKLLNITKGITDNQAAIANRVVAKISQTDADKAVAELLKRSDIAKITTDENVVRFAQNARKHFDETIDAQNKFRRMRGQAEIPKRAYYSPDQIKQGSLWSDAWGFGRDTGNVFDGPLPDFIRPDKPFVPHALARQANLPEYLKEMNLKTLLENYTNAASRDIFNTSIIHNNKSFAKQLDSMGLSGSARSIQDWTAESFAGLKGSLDRSAALSSTVARGMKHFRRSLVRGVFPLNFAWNAFVQMSSSVFTVTRYGVRNSVGAMNDWMTNPKARKWVEDNAYSYIVKTGRAGKISHQDINAGMSSAVKLNRGKLESTTDAANFLTEAVERNLTGWSVLAARRSGQKRGLKGRALAEFASDGGAKTQSMYNLEDLPGILRNETVKTAAPFNTFRFEAFNSLREFAGRAGVSPDNIDERMKWMLRFFGGIYAANTVSNAAIGRDPWDATSFMPFYNLWGQPIEESLKGQYSSSTQHLPSPVGITSEFATGMQRFIENGDSRKLRQASVRYLPGLFGIPGGTQVNRMIDGAIAIADGGVEDSAGRMLFPITGTKEQTRAILAGPWATEGGREYWDDREKKWIDLLRQSEDEKREDTGAKRPDVKGKDNPFEGMTTPGR